MGQPRTKFTSKNSSVALALPVQGGNLCIADKGGPRIIVASGHLKGDSTLQCCSQAGPPK